MKLFRSMLALALAAVMMLTVSVGFAASAATVINLNEVENPAYKGGTFTTTEDGLGFTANCDPMPAEGYGYLYIDLHQYVETTPYLVYQVTTCDGGWCTLCPGGYLNPEGAVNLEKDGERHTFDLRTIDSATLVICLTMASEMNFPLAYLTDDPDADPTQTTGGDTTGGTTGGDNTQTGAESAVAV
ncbi:MAG: hypothetical protein IKI50_01000, partial [Clostridia bacterium]|nr:hypothetical protein [Clostridia bacterium]